MPRELGMFYKSFMKIRPRIVVTVGLYTPKVLCYLGMVSFSHKIKMNETKKGEIQINQFFENVYAIILKVKTFPRFG
jgi:hypothetical protein